MHSIPTKYKGRVFRSRLEARWARMFDLMEWKWEYEPYDLNGWIPDFYISGEKKKILVEVKPAFSYNEFNTEKLHKACHGIEKTVHNHEHRYDGTDPDNLTEILLLGATILEGEIDCDVGWKWDRRSETPFVDVKRWQPGDPLTQPHELPWNQADYIWNNPGALGWWVDGDMALCNKWEDKWGLTAEYGSYQDRITGLYEGDHLLDWQPVDYIAHLWNRAGNKVQWKSPV